MARARSRQSNKEYAIKLITNVFYSPYEAKKVLREIQILRKLSCIHHNIFSVRLYDVGVVPLGTDENGELQFDDVFIVQECFGIDFTMLFKSVATQD